MASAEAKPILEINYPGEMKMFVGRSNNCLCGSPVELGRADLTIPLRYSDKFVLVRGVPAKICADKTCPSDEFDPGIVSTIYRQVAIRLSKWGMEQSAAALKDLAVRYEVCNGVSLHGMAAFREGDFTKANNR